ncbi:MAG: DNA repair exonuclease [Planctomycetota bacterium]|nr:DNA repair exonuclease [Planctomycetota bacterium]
MLIAHLSDLHLGRKSNGDPQGAIRLNSLRRAIVDKLPQAGPEAIVIAGDMFDSSQVERGVVQEAARVLDKARNKDDRPVPVVVISGNHDPSEAETLWATFREVLGPDTLVQVVLTQQVIELLRGELRIEAYPCPTRYSPERPWEHRLPPKGGAGVTVVLAHGTLLGGPVPEDEQEAYPFTEADAAGLGVEYVALGHFHGVYPPWGAASEIERGYCYCGTHEPDQFSGDAGWAILASLRKGKPALLKRLRLAERLWQEFEILGPADIGKLKALRQQVEADSDPQRFVVRVKVGAKTRLAPEEAAQLDEIKAALTALGVCLQQHGEFATYINVEALDLQSLPGGAVKHALLALQGELNGCADPARRELLSAALQIGWQLCKEEGARR